MLFYYITDRSAFPGDECTQRRRLLDKIAEAASGGVDYIQLREKDLSARELELLAREAMSIICELRSGNRETRTALLINSRTDVALSVGADGVHLRGEDISPEDVRSAWKRGAGVLGGESLRRNPLISAACHSAKEVEEARSNQATLAIFSPVFEKKDAIPSGCEGLREACRSDVAVIALGGVTVENARSCIKDGASGIAGIRFFQENDIADVVRRL